jgi:hypothetical protein
VTALLDRLRQDLPAEWQQAEPAKWGEAWYADPVRTVYLQVGDDRLFVSARARGAISGPIGGGQRSIAWRDLRRSICEGVARIAIDHARRGMAVPATPAWALPALRQGVSRRRFAMGMEAELAEQKLQRLARERAILAALTLGA